MLQVAVTRVVDRVTIRFNLDGAEQAIRSIGADIPEIVAPGAPGAYYDQVANDFPLAPLPPDTDAWLETVVSNTDRYDQLLS